MLSEKGWDDVHLCNPIIHHLAVSAPRLADGWMKAKEKRGKRPLCIRYRVIFQNTVHESLIELADVPLVRRIFAL